VADHAVVRYMSTPWDCVHSFSRIMNREFRVDYSREISLLSIRGKIGDNFPTVRPKLLCLNFFKTHADA